jgi:hypothetical protein
VLVEGVERGVGGVGRACGAAEGVGVGLGAGGGVGEEGGGWGRRPGRERSAEQGEGRVESREAGVVAHGNITCAPVALQGARTVMSTFVPPLA